MALTFQAYTPGGLISDGTLPKKRYIAWEWEVEGDASLCGYAIKEAKGLFKFTTPPNDTPGESDGTSAYNKKADGWGPIPQFGSDVSGVLLDGPGKYTIAATNLKQPYRCVGLDGDEKATTLYGCILYIGACCFPISRKLKNINMNKLSILISACFILVGCAQNMDRLPWPEDAEVSRQIVGTWVHNATSTNEVTSTLVFGSDGKLEVKRKQMPLRGTWRMRNHDSCFIMVTVQGMPQEVWTVRYLTSHELMLWPPYSSSGLDHKPPIFHRVIPVNQGTWDAKGK